MFAVALWLALAAVFAVGFFCGRKSGAMRRSNLWCARCGDRLTRPRHADPHRDRDRTALDQTARRRAAALNPRGFDGNRRVS